MKKKIKKIIYILTGVFEYNFSSLFNYLTPKKVLINLTYKCNSRCVMCNIWKRKKTKEIGIQNWKKIVTDKLFKKIKVITFSGGEAMLQKDFLKITNLFITQSPKLEEIILITNGLLPNHILQTVKLLIEQCTKKNINLHVTVSLDGTGKMHDFTRGITGAAKKSKETLLRLKKLKEKYEFSLGSASLILKQNLNKVQEIKNWFEKHKINHSFQIVGFHNTFIKNLDTREKVDFTKKTERKLLSVLANLASQTKLNRQWFKTYYWKDLYEMYAHKKNRTTPCPFLKDQLAIDCIGDVYYCLSQNKIGNFLKEKRSILEIYKDPKNLSFRKKLNNGPCLKCNSGCDVNEALAKDLKKILFFKFTGKLLGKKP